jgi:hypothetical protein
MGTPIAVRGALASRPIAATNRAVAAVEATRLVGRAAGEAVEAGVERAVDREGVIASSPCSLLGSAGVKLAGQTG